MAQSTTLLEASVGRTRVATRDLVGWRLQAITALFAISGAAALVDQVCFSKYLIYVVGSTAHAVSAVLAAFMAGMMLGAHFGGKWSARVARPLLAYGIAELAVGASVALAPWAFSWLTPAYLALARSSDGSLWGLSVLRWGFAFVIVMLPTAAMGMTLPLLAPALKPAVAGTRAKDIARVYAANTLGGAFGALLGAYALLPTFGLSGTLALSAAVSALAGIVACFIGWRVMQPSHDERQASAPTPVDVSAEEVQTRAFGISATALGALAFGSGAITFVTEVVATHLLAVIVGNSAYAFALILAVFLIALCFGAWLAPRFASRLGSVAMTCALASSGAALALTFPIWDELPFLFGGLGEVFTTFGSRELVRALVAFAILGVPTTCMGLVFPLILMQTGRDRQVGARIGRLTVFNTLGAALGALAAGYVLLPWLGSGATLLFVAGCFAVAAVLVQRDPSARSRVSLGASLLTVVVIAVVPAWDLAQLTAGANVYFEGYEPARAVLFAKEHVQGGVTTVTEDEHGVHTLYTNGKFQGNTGWEMQAQRLFAHYPSLFVHDFDRALVIGVGTGTTLGTYAAYPWSAIDVVEISPHIVEAARSYFSGPNRGSLDDPRVHLRLDDGRNALVTDDTRYDLIGMELSSVWFAGAANLYSREFYALVANHLTEQGVFQQWVQLHHIHDAAFATIVNTLRQQFPFVALFYGGGQGILVAAEAPLVADAARLAALERGSKLAELLEGRQLRSFLADVLVVGAGLDAYLQQAAATAGLATEQLVSDDDNLLLEYATPKGNVLPWSTRDVLVARLREHQDPAAIQRLLVP